MSNKNQGSFFPIPGGEVTVEIPDGVAKTQGFTAPNSLTNARWAHGGFDGCGYGAFASDDDMYVVPLGRTTDRFRIG